VSIMLLGVTWVAILFLVHATPPHRSHIASEALSPILAKQFKDRIATLYRLRRAAPSRANHRDPFDPSRTREQRKQRPQGNAF
jgi:hypothetical protein